MLYWSLPENFTPPKYFSGQKWSESLSDNIYEVSLDAALSGGASSVVISLAELEVSTDESMSVIVAKAGATATASHFFGKVKFSKGGSPAYYIEQGDIVYVTPNEKRRRESTVLANSAYTPSFWISLVSAVTSVTFRL